eukprot:snap_masked-scaffold104_size368486-processed-gene-2.9 protein:Tk07548 transcript:snap_masked-scaffold104_size368486-processed-gene-2.9-mRNA-1 annotation:"sulfonate abc transporter substrate-binding protein"
MWVKSALCPCLCHQLIGRHLVKHVPGRAFFHGSNPPWSKKKWLNVGVKPTMEELFTTSSDFKPHFFQSFRDSYRFLLSGKLDQIYFPGSDPDRAKGKLMSGLELITAQFKDRAFVDEVEAKTSPSCMAALKKSIPNLTRDQRMELAVCPEDVILVYVVDHKMDRANEKKLTEVTLAYFELAHYGKMMRYTRERSAIEAKLTQNLASEASLQWTKAEYLKSMSKLRDLSAHQGDWERQAVFRARNSKFKYCNNTDKWILDDFLSTTYSQLTLMEQLKWKFISDWALGSGKSSSNKIGLTSYHGKGSRPPEDMLRMFYIILCYIAILGLGLVIMMEKVIQLLTWGPSVIVKVQEYHES